MGSINISITEDVYTLLKRLKKDDESFSDIIRSLVEEKDISKCYGLLANYKDDLKFIEEETNKARKQKWRADTQ
ncbi:MAG: antitoxin VapB family protein [Candidatus Micrarchaeota archaeon]